MSRFSDELAARIEQLLPAPDQPHVPPIDIYRAVDIGAIGTTRHILRKIEAAGRAQSVIVAGRNGKPSRHYRRAMA